MATERDNLATIESFNRAYNEQRIDDAAVMYASDGRLVHVTRGIDVRGRDAIRDLMIETLARLPNRRSECRNAIAAGEFVVTENHYEVVVPESAEPLTFDFCHIYRLVDGKIVEHREYG